MFFVLFYNSNLRQTLIVPDYEPQIHNAEDILINNITVIYTDSPNESLEQKFIHEKHEYPDIYNMVGGIIRIIIFFFELFHFYYACFSSVMASGALSAILLDHSVATCSKSAAGATVLTRP